MMLSGLSIDLTPDWMDCIGWLIVRTNEELMMQAPRRVGNVGSTCFCSRSVQDYVIPGCVAANVSHSKMIRFVYTEQLQPMLRGRSFPREAHLASKMQTIETHPQTWIRFSTIDIPNPWGETMSSVRVCDCVCMPPRVLVGNRMRLCGEVRKLITFTSFHIPPSDFTSVRPSVRTFDHPPDRPSAANAIRPTIRSNVLPQNNAAQHVLNFREGCTANVFCPVSPKL